MGHKYSVGERVQMTAHSFNPVDYEIIGLLPENGEGEFGYRLKSTSNGSERSVREWEIRLLKAQHKPAKAAKAEPNLSGETRGLLRNKFFWWSALTILLAALGGAALMAAFRGSQYYAGPGAFFGLIFGLTALALYLHKLRPRQVYLINRARAEGLAGSSFTE